MVVIEKVKIIIREKRRWLREKREKRRKVEWREKRERESVTVYVQSCEKERRRERR